MLKPVMNLSFLLVFLLISFPLLAGDAIWIDVRSAGEFSTGHVAGSVNIPHTEIAERIAEVTEDKEAQLNLYCRSGRRSGIAADVLEDMGFTNVTNVGGFETAMKEAAKQGSE